ncbi:phosphoribosylanthranilate isomerase [soil metagenome]
MTKIKICGVTLPDDAARVAAAGVDFIGLNFWPKSKRYLALERAPLIAGIARSSGSAKIVGVFVNADHDEIVEIAQAVELDAIQLHGEEYPEDLAALAKATKLPIWKAIPTGSAKDVDNLDQWRTEMILLDTPSAGRGGAGRPFDWALAKDARRRFPQQSIVLAGGLDPTNVAAAIALVAPFAVDVATGVETAPGIKDAAKVAAFVAAVRGA